MYADGGRRRRVTRFAVYHQAEPGPERAPPTPLAKLCTSRPARHTAAPTGLHLRPRDGEHLQVDLVDRDLAVERRQHELLPGAALVQRPDAVVAARVPLDGRRVLRDEHVLAERRDGPVVAELLPAVVALGRFGEHLDEHGRVQQRVPRAVLEQGSAAHHRDVGVRVELGRGHVDPQVRGRDVARPVAKGVPQLADEVADDLVVLEARPRHREDLAVHELVPLRRAPFPGEVLRGRPDPLLGGFCVHAPILHRDHPFTTTFGRGGSKLRPSPADRKCEGDLRRVYPAESSPVVMRPWATRSHTIPAVTRAVLVSTAADRRLARAAAWLAERRRDEEIVVLGASIEAAAEITRLVALRRGATFGWQRSTLGRAAAALAGPALAARGLAPVGALPLEALTARVVDALRREGTLGRFAEVARFPGLP